MAAVQVLDTVELLEMIILELPIRDVFVKQRVSRRWHSIIHDSVQLQQALFLKPSTSPCPDDPPRLAQFTLDDSCVKVQASPGRKTVVGSVLSINGDRPIIRGTRGSIKHCDILRGFEKVDDQSAMGYPNASWRKMLLCQPPMDRVAFLINYQNGPITDSIGSDESPELTAITTLGGARMRYRELAQLEDLGAFVLNGAPYVGVQAFSEAMSEHLRLFEYARYKGDELEMGMGGEKDLQFTRVVFESALRHSRLRQSSTSRLRRRWN